MTTSDRALWLSNIYASRSCVSAAKTRADCEHELRVSVLLASALDSLTQAIEEIQREPSVHLPEPRPCVLRCGN